MLVATQEGKCYAQQRGLPEGRPETRPVDVCICLCPPVVCPSRRHSHLWGGDGIPRLISWALLMRGVEGPLLLNKSRFVVPAFFAFSTVALTIMGDS